MNVIKAVVESVFKSEPATLCVASAEIEMLLAQGEVKACLALIPSIVPSLPPIQAVVVGAMMYPSERRGAKARQDRLAAQALHAASVGSQNMAVYTKAERKKKIARFMEKRLRRKWHHAIQLKCRQVFATNRPRVNGRFVALPLAICPLIAKGVDMRNYNFDQLQLLAPLPSV